MFNSVSDARKSIESLMSTLQADESFSDPEVFEIIEALEELFDVVAAVNKKQQLFSADEVSAIGDQGLALIENLMHKISQLQLTAHQHDIEQILLIFSSWVIKHQGRLYNIHSIVDALATIANEVEDRVSLLQLSAFMTQVAHACSDAIQHDLDNTDPSRPWRALNMNRGIIATRTHDVEVMNSVFPELIKAIPMDAPLFFKEGMTEMERLDYPKAVRDLMQSYYQKTQLPAVH